MKTSPYSILSSFYTNSNDHNPEPALIDNMSDNMDMRGQKRIVRRHPLRKACTILVMVAIATIMYILFASKSSHFSIFKVTQNVYVNNEHPADHYHTESETFQDDYYSIVFDAGSTGTRIHVFHFSKKNDGSLVLLKELFRQTKPGLSFYANSPVELQIPRVMLGRMVGIVSKHERIPKWMCVGEKVDQGLVGVASVNGLLKYAKDYVPENRWSTTPIILKATAGLRLLPGRKAQVLLEEVRKLFMSSLFQKLGDDFVSIMDGESEGIFGWLTVNFLSGKTKEYDVSHMYGALDLGGGSIQITFPLPDKETALTEIPPSYIKSTDVASKKFTLYTHSYLGLGLMSARAGCLNATATKRSMAYIRKLKITSPCFPDGYSTVWKFSGIEFDISGSDQCSFENCLEVVKKITTHKEIDKPESVKNLELFAFSYFFDRALDLGRIDATAGGEVQVGDFIESAQAVCQRGNVKEKPFLCLDTTIISSLLTDGFGLGFHQTLKLKKKIDETEISWALGAALHLYEKTRSSHTS